ncbi:MAG: class I SAM-dependent methyltransferase [Verrucomicrobia bacterium]|nr:class I SAM-dependent methyltransferase [Verrucomicrobiota bacterium]
MNKPSYGIDAPNVVFNLLVFSFVALLLTGLSFYFDKPVWLILYFSAISLSLFCTGCWLIYSTKVAKPRLLARLVEELHLQGDEKILDIGCGRGMLLIEAAKRIQTGKVCGIDLWSRKDQSGNSMDKTLSNAQLEKVDDRIEVQTADMRSIPYPDSSFDVVVSNLAIHNVPGEAGRLQALSEIMRVLKPGGSFLLLDIHYAKQYAQILKEKTQTISLEPIYKYCPTLRVLKGTKK